jgi:hypothetical protein
VTFDIYQIRYQEDVFSEIAADVHSSRVVAIRFIPRYKLGSTDLSIDGVHSINIYKEN